MNSVYFMHNYTYYNFRSSNSLTDTTPIDAIAAVPYGWHARQTTPGLFRIGDQAGVIPSLAGEGNGIALASGRSAAEAFLQGGREEAPHWQARFGRQSGRPIGRASAFGGSAL